MVNFELSTLQTQLMQAGEQNQTKKKFKNAGHPSIPVIRYIGRCLTGQAWLTALVCLSQSPQNGWETWFSCEYGKALAKLQAPVRKVKIEDAEKLETKLIAEVAKAKFLFETTPTEGLAASKYYELRKSILRGAEQELELVQELLNVVKSM